MLLAFFRGMYCPFCRRQIAKLGLVRDKLLAAGVETLAVVASPLERTRLYFRYRPTRVPLAVDPDLASHRAFGISQFSVTPEFRDSLRTVRIDVMGELPRPVLVREALTALQEKDRFELTAADTRKEEQQNSPGPLETGQFLVDRHGIVRWVNLDLARDGVAGFGRFPSDEELLAVARAHGGWGVPAGKGMRPARLSLTVSAVLALTLSATPGSGPVSASSRPRRWRDDSPERAGRRSTSASGVRRGSCRVPEARACRDLLARVDAASRERAEPPAQLDVDLGSSVATIS